MMFSVRKTQHFAYLLFKYLVMILFALVCIIPFFWMVTTSFKTDMDAIRIPPVFFPWPLVTEHYTKVLTESLLLNALKNSFLVSTTSMAGVLLSTTMAAYAFARLNFWKKNLFFGALVAMMLIPRQMMLIPLYVIFSKLGWVNTYLPIIVPQVMVNAYGVFMQRQFMSRIPKSYDESAWLDGAGYYRVYFRIILPLCTPSLVTLGLFNFINNWNDFLSPLIYLNSETKFTTPLVVSMMRDQYKMNWGLMMAASTIAILPIAALYLFSQRFFIQGIALSGMKG